MLTTLHHVRITNFRLGTVGVRNGHEEYFVCLKPSLLFVKSRRGRIRCGEAQITRFPELWQGDPELVDVICGGNQQRVV